MINKCFRNKKIPILHFLVLAAFLCLLFQLFGNEKCIAAENNINIKEQEEKLKQIEQRKIAIQEEIGRMKQEEADYQKSLEKIQILLTESEKELQEAKTSYENTIKQIEKMEEELDIEQTKMELQLAILESRLKKIYKYNEISYLSVLFDSKDFSQFLNRYRYLECILESDAGIIQQVSEQVDFIKKQKDSLENKKEITKLLEQEIINEKKNIEMSIDAKNKYIARIEEERKKQIATLEELEKSSAQISEIIEIAYREKEKEEQAKKNQANNVPVRTEPTLQAKKGIFQLPLRGTIILNYGQQKTQELNAYVFNSGVDISASLGEAVRSASFGTVIYTGNVKGYGDIIIIDHGGNVVTLYAHLSKVLVGLNEQVSKGQIIGQVGTSGGVSSPRLHFEVRVEGKPVNPFEWL